MAKKKRKKNFIKKLWAKFEEHMSQIIVAFSFGVVLLFTVVVIVIATAGVEISSTLIEYFYKFFGFEMLALSGIKISKHIGSAFGKVEEKIDGIICEEDDYDGEIEE